MTEIDIRNVTKVFDTEDGEVVAVDDLSVTIEEGEFVVFVGPSGCGKTTTLRCIAGLEAVTRGTIQFGDEDVTDVPAKDRDIAMVFQNYALYPHMTVHENIAFGLKLSTQLPTSEIETRVDETMEMLGIADLRNHTPDELSGGQQQRVALGRAIIREPGVFLLDEPLSNLDAKLRDEMRTEIQQLQHELDITAIYVTHDQTEAMAMGDRIAVMNDGRLQQIGVPESLYLDPVNEFVGTFIGSPSMNVFDADVRRTNDGVTLDGPADFNFDVTASTSLEQYESLRVGIRPEDIVPDETGNVAETVVVEPMGDENHVYLELGAISITAIIDSSVRPKAGRPFEFGFEESDLYLFDPQTGETVKSKDAPQELEVELA